MKALLTRDTGYRWKGTESPLLVQVRDILYQANLSSMDIWERILDETGEIMSLQTIDNLMNGKTKRPQLRAVELILVALKFDLTIKFRY